MTRRAAIEMGPTALVAVEQHFPMWLDAGRPAGIFSGAEWRVDEAF